MGTIDHEIGRARRASPEMNKNYPPAQQSNNYGITPVSNRQIVSNSVLAGVGSPVPLGQDRSKMLLPGAATYSQNTRMLAKSSHEQ
jgi:hypothetical protein